MHRVEQSSPVRNCMLPSSANASRVRSLLQHPPRYHGTHRHNDALLLNCGLGSTGTRAVHYTLAHESKLPAVHFSSVINAAQRHHIQTATMLTRVYKHIEHCVMSRKPGDHCSPSCTAGSIHTSLHQALRWLYSSGMRILSDVPFASLCNEIVQSTRISVQAVLLTQRASLPWSIQRLTVHHGKNIVDRRLSKHIADGTYQSYAQLAHNQKEPQSPYSILPAINNLMQQNRSGSCVHEVIANDWHVYKQGGIRAMMRMLHQHQRSVEAIASQYNIPFVPICVFDNDVDVHW